MGPLKVVVRYANGRVVKGYTHNFSPNSPAFNIHPLHADTTKMGIRVLIKDLKAIFFVRDFIGDAAYNERHDPTDVPQHPGRVAEVEFKDGEVLIGTTLGFDLSRLGFFIFPLDPRSNNKKVFAVSSAVRRVRDLTSVALKF